jgi:hypothetical protein
MSKTVTLTPGQIEWIQKNLPDYSQSYVSTPLTNYVTAFTQDDSNFVSDRVFPNLAVRDQTGQFWTLPKGTFTRDEMKKRGPLSEAVQVDWAPGRDTYSVDPWAVKMLVPDMFLRGNRLPFDVQRVQAGILTKMALIRREREFAASFLGTSIWGKDIAGVAGAPTLGTSVRQWDQANSTPLEDIAYLMTLQQIATEGQRPNRMLLGRQVWDVLKNHPQILDRVNRGQTTGAAEVRKADVAALMELDEIVIADAVWNSANEGQAVVDQLIIGKVGLLYYATPTPQMMVPTAGLTLSWNGYLPGTSDMGMAFETYRIPNVKGTHFELNWAFGFKKVSADHGTFLNTLVA